jgi:hypothetical protein
VPAEDAVGSHAKRSEQRLAKAREDRDLLFQTLQSLVVLLVGDDVVGPSLDGDKILYYYLFVMQMRFLSYRNLLYNV